MWTETGGMGTAFRLYGGPNGNFINLDENGTMAMYVGTPNVGNDIQLTAGSTEILLTDLVSGEGATPGTLYVSIGGVDGTTGQYLGSDGAGNVTWSTPTPSIVASGTIDQTGFTGPTGASSLWYKEVGISGMYPNGLVLATANGTPTISFAAWVVTVQPDVDKITIWTAGYPVMADETWEAHYAVTSFGTPIPPNWNSTGEITDTSSTTASISGQFLTTSVSGTEPITYDCGYSDVSGGGEGGYTFVSVTPLGEGTGFMFNISGLESDKNYYVVARATNSGGSALGPELQISTQVPP